MARLTAKSPCAGLDLDRTGMFGLKETDYGSITSVAPFRGREREVSTALKSAIGTGLPAPNRVTGKAGARIAWSGLGQALVLGPRVAAAGSGRDRPVRCLGQPGAQRSRAQWMFWPALRRWTCGTAGSGAAHAARSLLGHVPCLFLRTGATRYELLVFRSMTRTAVRELGRAIEEVTAQNGPLTCGRHGPIFGP